MIPGHRYASGRHSVAIEPVYLIPTFLPGRLELWPGSRNDYLVLERFHYRQKSPATFASIWTVRRAPEVPGTWVRDCPQATASGCSAQADRFAAADAAPIAVIVLSYPVLACALREKALGLGRLTVPRRIRFVNEQIRTISRVIVHPAYRGLGLARFLVQWVLQRCPTRYVEALAVMGRAHPFFELAGMKAFAAQQEPARPVYYLFDRVRQALPRLPVRPCNWVIRLAQSRPDQPAPRREAARSA